MTHPNAQAQLANRHVESAALSGQLASDGAIEEYVEQRVHGRVDQRETFGQK